MKSKEKLILDIHDMVGCCIRGELSDMASLLNVFLFELQDYLRSGIVDDVKLKKISYSLETVMILQNRSDWVALSDVLEYELVNLL